MVDLSGYLKELGWSQGELARRIKVKPNTVNRWVNKKTNCPEVVILYLRLLLDIHGLING